MVEEMKCCSLSSLVRAFGRNDNNPGRVSPFQGCIAVLPLVPCLFFFLFSFLPQMHSLGEVRCTPTRTLVGETVRVAVVFAAT